MIILIHRDLVALHLVRAVQFFVILSSPFLGKPKRALQIGSRKIKGLWLFLTKKSAIAKPLFVMTNGLKPSKIKGYYYDKNSILANLSDPADQNVSNSAALAHLSSWA